MSARDQPIPRRWKQTTATSTTVLTERPWQLESMSSNSKVAWLHTVINWKTCITYFT